MKETFVQIHQLVRQIPAGRVATYGQIARLLGRPRLSRVVGYAMHDAPPDVPCHRVVNRFGGLCGAFLPCGKETHRMLLEMEGVGFEPDGTVDLDRFLWMAGKQSGSAQDRTPIDRRTLPSYNKGREQKGGLCHGTGTTAPRPPRGRCL